MFDFYDQFEERLEKWPEGDRKILVAGFLHVGGNSIVSSLNLLVAGMIVPAGNLMRQFAEAIAMAMLCAVPATGVLEAFESNRRTYPVHKSLDIILRAKNASALTRALGFDAAGWQSFRRGMSLFDSHSHSTVIALGASIRFGKERGGVILGSEYDPQKFAIYRKELSYRKRAARDLLTVLKVIDRAMLAPRAAT